MMHASTKALDLVEHFEGFSSIYYVDIAGVGTIGFGHTGKYARPGYQITLQAARDLLLDELRLFENDINRRVHVALHQHQFDALLSWHYNTGALASSTLLKVLNRGEYEQVDDQMLRWNKYTDPMTRELKISTGLTRRRMCEAIVWHGLPLPSNMLQGVTFRSMNVVPSNPDASWFRKLLQSV